MRVVRSVDYHCHTYHSPCGQPEMIPEVVMKTAEERGIETLGFTDHFYRHLLHENGFAALRGEVAGKNGGLKLFIGCEADVVSPTEIAITEEEAARFDYVLCSVHYQNRQICEQAPSAEPEEVAKHFLAMFRRAAETPYIDIIPHPFFLPPNTYDAATHSFLTDGDLLEVLEQAKENGIAVEISPRALTPGQTEFYLRFYRLAKRVGLKFSIGTDAHRLVNVAITGTLEPVIRAVELRVEDLWCPAR